MKKTLLSAVLLCGLLIPVSAQTDWSKFAKLLDDGSYKSAYGQAEAVFRKTKNSTELLTAAWYMSRAARYYQEDVYDSTIARYRAILPRLDKVDRAVCYAFLGVQDSALMDETLLKSTPADRLRRFCAENQKREGIDLTPTAYDVVVRSFLSPYNPSVQDISLMRNLIDFHGDDRELGLCLSIELLQMETRRDYDIKIDTLVQPVINKYRDTKSPFLTELYYTMAQYHDNNERHVEAVRYCDSAFALAPESVGGAACANLKNSICAASIGFHAFSENSEALPDKPSLHCLVYRNLSCMHFSVYPFDGDVERLFAHLPKPVRQWQLEVKNDGSHKQNYINFEVPALPAGRYLLVASSDGKETLPSSAYIEISCSDMKIVRADNAFQLLDARKGKPIVAQLVECLDHYDGTNVIDSGYTDANGRVDLTPNLYSYRLRVKRNNCVFETYLHGRYSASQRSMKTTAKLYLDRPIYRPGDTLRVAALCYKADGVDGSVIPAVQGHFRLYDPNGKMRDTVTFLTDAHGMASASFVLPADGLAGQWRVRFYSYNWIDISKWVRVEEYKAPKFTVSLDNGSQASQSATFGEPYTLHGIAQAYSGASLTGAKVVYSIVREPFFIRWWEDDYSGPVEVASDSLEVAADGSFDITFTPLPDSSRDLSRKPAFAFHVNVTVTDLNGESHDTYATFCVGSQNRHLHLAETDSQLSELHGVTYTLTDLNNRPVTGTVRVTLERLALPDEPLLRHPIVSHQFGHTLTRDRFRDHFPGFAYSTDELQPQHRRVEWTRTLTHTADGLTPRQTVELPSKELMSGLYRIIVSLDDLSDTAYTTLTLPDERRVQSTDLFWCDLSSTSCLPGESLTLRYGSLFDDVRIFYSLTGPDRLEHDTRWLPASANLKKLLIPVDTTLLGGFQIHLMAVHNGVVHIWEQNIDVPFTHKQLKVDITTFRDRLQPGQEEQWTIQVSPQATPHKPLTTNLSLRSTLILTLYDDALNSYGGGNSWNVYPWRYCNYVNYMVLNADANYSAFNAYDLITPLVGENPPRWSLSLLDVGWASTKRRYYKYNDEEEFTATARGEDDRVTMQGNVRMNSIVMEKDVLVLEEAVPVIAIGTSENGMRISADDIAHMPSVADIVAEVGGLGYSDGSGSRTPVQMRSNLNSLAFFVAGLHTDSTGTATYRFRVPELLTRWNLRGIAYTDDLRIGTLDRSLVTQKPLMVQPNIPRFLRHGDSLVLMAKVLNLSDEQRQVRVAFSLSDAATGRLIYTDEKFLSVTSAAQVTFPIPDIPNDVHVATYEIVAQTCDKGSHPDLPSLSDGERAQIPVVSSRQAVTISKAFYINGRGEKNVDFQFLPSNSPSATPNLFATEFVSNPIWLAIKAMPYINETENPSSLYLANRLYVNILAGEILNGLKDFKALKDLAPKSPLNANDDIKQTLLEATPWLRDAQSEEEQQRAIAIYFDSARLSTEYATLYSQIINLQRPDGGWPWMPGGESSAWTTQQMLQLLVPAQSTLSSSVKKALKYLDSEEQRHYEKYIKPNLKKTYQWNPDNIDYLYTRSFYGKATTEAYRFYYNNALKNYKKYENLTTQAQLALIFQRHGDKKAARDLVRRLKEKSLQSDEMGLYWRDNRGGYCWYQRPIETQALLIQAFREVTPSDTLAIALMQQWLLKQKQTTHWGNDRATVQTINALLTPQTLINSINSNNPIPSPVSSRLTGPALDSLVSRGDTTLVFRNENSGIAWGSVFYQYTDDLDRIPASETGITLRRTYSGSWKVGEKVHVRIDIRCDRTMEYLELIDGRPSCTEPLSTRAGWHWNQGLRYYVEVKNTATHCYINRLEKGNYVVEYDVYVTNPGTFLAGPVTMQCMYAPEFRAIAPAERITVD